MGGFRNYNDSFEIEALSPAYSILRAGVTESLYCENDEFSTVTICHKNKRTPCQI